MNSKNRRIAKNSEVTRITGKSRASLYDIQNPKSPRFDPTFPKRIKTGLRSVGFFLDEVLTWLEGRKVATVHTQEVIK